MWIKPAAKYRESCIAMTLQFESQAPQKAVAFMPLGEISQTPAASQAKHQRKASKPDQIIVRSCLSISDLILRSRNRSVHFGRNLNIERRKKIAEKFDGLSCRKALCVKN